MDNRERDKFLTEAIGECWQISTFYNVDVT